MNMQENQYKKQGKHRKTQETEIQKKFPKRKKKIPQTIFYPLYFVWPDWLDPVFLPLSHACDLQCVYG